MQNLFDASNYFMGTVAPGPGGTFVERDAFGAPLHTFAPTGVGLGEMRDALGNVVMHSMQVGDQTRLFDGSWNPTGYVSNFMGKATLYSPTHAPLLTWDPMSGNVTNAMLGLVGKIR